MKGCRASLLRGALVLTMAAVAVPVTPAGAQERRKLSRDEMARYQGIHAVVDAVAAGKQPAPADAHLVFHNHFLLSRGDVYVPYVVEIEPGKFTSFPLVMYVRAVARPVGAPSAAAARSAVPAKAASASAPFAFEDVAFVTPSADSTIQRAMELLPGDYDIYIALSEKPLEFSKGASPQAATPAKPPAPGQPGKPAKPAKNDRNVQQAPPAPGMRTVVFTQSLTVPNLKAGLTTSSIILAKTLEPAEQQLNGQEQLDQPFTISGYHITPAFSSSFAKSAELLWVFYIYNEGAAPNGKPDLDVEYNFFRGAEEKPFMNLPPSAYNAANLPPEFNLASGHQVFVGQGTPLGALAPGDYRVDIRITDKTSSQSITRTVPFSVTP